MGVRSEARRQPEAACVRAVAWDWGEILLGLFAWAALCWAVSEFLRL